MGWKTVEELSGPEVMTTAEGLASYAEDCREIGQGINSKESIRFRRCMERIETERLGRPAEIASLHTRWDPSMAAHYPMLLRLFENGGTLEGMRKLFAPA